MHYDPVIQQLAKEFYKLLSSHCCSVLPLMLERQKIFAELCGHKKGLRDYSVTVFNLKTIRFEFHNSCFNNRLKLPTVCTALQNPMAQLMELTEPKSMAFCLETMIESYRFLMNLPKEERKLFNVAYIRLLLERNGLYHPYLHRMYVSEFDEEGNPWLITTETSRLADINVPEFRYVSPLSGHYTEKHAYSRHLLNLELNEQDKALLIQYRHDCKMKMIGEKLHKSPHTISNIYNRIEKIYGVHSIHTASEIARVMEILTGEWHNLN